MFIQPNVFDITKEQVRILHQQRNFTPTTNFKRPDADKVTSKIRQTDYDSGYYRKWFVYEDGLVLMVERYTVARGSDEFLNTSTTYFGYEIK